MPPQPLDQATQNAYADLQSACLVPVFDGTDILHVEEKPGATLPLCVHQNRPGSSAEIVRAYLPHFFRLSKKVTPSNPSKWSSAVINSAP